MLDALIILRHSIHENSFYNNKRSKYRYQMIAFVHRQCAEYVALIQRLGYIPLVRDTPVNVSAITTNDWYRTHVVHENCCGDKEFIKLYAYTLTEYPIFVHWDLDTALLQPMDDLFDAILFPSSSPTGLRARSRISIQNPTIQTLPEQIDAFYTRDITSAKPWEKVTAIQGGFLVGRPNVGHFQTYLRFIMAANYTPGRGPASGWGGIGYGGFQGAMAYQGVLAYFYDQIHPEGSVELDVCRWNNVVADVIWRGPERPELIGTCRQYPVGDDSNFDTNLPELGHCEDCRVLPLEETMSVHFTACRKPWDCTVPKPRVPDKRNRDHFYRLQNLTNKTTCRNLFRKYFEFRSNFERLLHEHYGSVRSNDGSFEPSYFRGYCKGRGDYISIHLPDSFNAKVIYGF